MKWSYKLFPNEKKYTLRLEGEFNINVFNFLVLVYEVDLYKEWMPFCQSGTDLKNCTKYDRIAEFDLHVPFINDRGAFCYGIGVNRLDHNDTILIVSKSI